MIILPKYLYEFDRYKNAGFEFLTEEQYNYYSRFLRDIDSNMAELLKIPADISMVYCYTCIPGKGEESLELVQKAINILEDNNIDLPDPEDVAFSPFTEKDGWGEKFDGTRLSIVLNKQPQHNESAATLPFMPPRR